MASFLIFSSHDLARCLLSQVTDSHYLLFRQGIILSSLNKTFRTSLWVDDSLWKWIWEQFAPLPYLEYMCTNKSITPRQAIQQLSHLIRSVQTIHQHKFCFSQHHEDYNILTQHCLHVLHKMSSPHTFPSSSELFHHYSFIYKLTCIPEWMIIRRDIVPAYLSFWVWTYSRLHPKRQKILEKFLITILPSGACEQWKQQRNLHTGNTPEECLKWCKIWNETNQWRNSQNAYPISLENPTMVVKQ